MGAFPHLPMACTLLLTQVGCMVLQGRGELIFQGRAWGEKAVTVFKP